MPERFLHIEKEGDLAVWRLDATNEEHNKLSLSALAEIEEAITDAARDERIAAVVIISGKPRSFVVGADLRELQRVQNRQEAGELSRRAHNLLRQVRSLGKPTVAAIHGPALGGGLELALACSMRVATDDPATRFALPEVQLGILPGGGGTQLLPRLIGVRKALPLLLTGKNVYPKPGKSMGLIDALIHRPGLLHAAKSAARQLVEEPAEDGSVGLPDRLLESNPLTRKLIYAGARDRTLASTRGNYPAPVRIIECVREGMENGLEAGLEAEERHFADLAVTPESRELVRLFFVKKRAEKNPYSDQAKPVRRIGIVGAGLMGGGIAQVTAENGIEVVVKDQSLELAAAARRNVYRSATSRVDKGAMRPFDRDRTLERVHVVETFDAFAHVDLVIEAAPEDLSLKHQIIADVERATGPDTVFASNTSSIPIARLAEGSTRPDRLIGMHYFSPVPKVPLLEIVRQPETPEEVLATAVDVGLRQGKTVIVVGDGPGFYTTRILALYMNEALDLLDDGASIDHVDEAMRDYGFPMGPFELFDLVGLEVAAKISGVMATFFSSRGVVANQKAAALVDVGLKGRKSSSGFYTYRKGKKKDANEAVYAYFGATARTDIPRERVQDRLAMAMVNEAVYCLQDAILASPEAGDLGAVFGLGFPPFRGGPFRFIDRLGADAAVERLQALQSEHGPQFRPSELLRSHAERREPFHT